MTERITARILKDAEQEAQELISAAQKEAQEMLDSASKNAEKLQRDAETEARSALAETERRYVVVAELDAKKDRLAAKVQVLEEAYEAAQRALMELPSNRYREIYRTLVLQAIESGDEGIAPALDETRIDQSFVDDLNEVMRERQKNASLHLLPARADISGGLLVCRGKMEINLESAAVLRNVREQTQAEIAEILFGEA